MNRLAILDWGIGGLGFLKEWRLRRPDEGVVYFSDSGFPPYGKVPPDELRERLEKVVAWLGREYGVTHCVFACNAASTVVGEIECGKVEVRGIIEPAAKWLRENLPPGRVTVTGGVRTIASGIYERLLPGYEVTGIVGQSLSAMVEAGRLEGPEVEEAVRESLGKAGPNLFLACTHYIALREVFAQVLPGTTLHDPVPGVAEVFSKKWHTMAGGDLFLTTGSAKEMEGSGWAAFGVGLTAREAEGV